MISAKTKRKIKENLVGYILITPLLISLIFFVIYPLVMALFDSFFLNYVPKRYGGHNWETFGLGNYKQAFEDPAFGKAFKLTIIYSVINIPITLILSFLIGLALSKDFKGVQVYRVLYYLPCVIPGIISAMIYKYIYSGEDWGLLNSIFLSLGLDKSDFFESKDQFVALLSFMSTGIFGLAGSMPFWVAGFKAVPKSYYEAARLDGASGVRQFFTITVPMMSKYIFYQLVCGLIGSFQIGQGVLTLSSRGGYEGNLTFYGLLIYNQTLGEYGFNMGYASALSYLLFIVIAGLSILTFKFNKFVYYEGND